jgi:hypothetical protein
MEEAAISGQGPVESVEPSKKKKYLYVYVGFLRTRLFFILSDKFLFLNYGPRATSRPRKFYGLSICTKCVFLIVSHRAFCNVITSAFINFKR